jgi:hypothetical protein
MACCWRHSASLQTCYPSFQYLRPTLLRAAFPKSGKKRTMHDRWHIGMDRALLRASGACCLDRHLSATQPLGSGGCLQAEPLSRRSQRVAAGPAAQRVGSRASRCPPAALRVPRQQAFWWTAQPLASQSLVLSRGSGVYNCRRCDPLDVLVMYWRGPHRREFGQHTTWGQGGHQPGTTPAMTAGHTANTIAPLSRRRTASAPPPP